ncbi:MAG TPA: CAP domain-containing protein [Polyangiaceae bacterium]|nr:CAP domain-containing protein [Polyangiaceae bacterium]
MGRTWVARGSSSRAGSALGALACAHLLGCSATPSAGAPASATRTQITPATASDGGELFSFPEVIQSPLGVAQVPPSLGPFFSQCQAGDAALARVAERFARRQAEGSAPLDVSEISFALRAEGSPYVWPRAWTLEGRDLENEAAVERMHGWLSSFGDGGERRCGVALASTRDRHVLAAVAVDALADLEPLPVRLRAGTWVDVNASLLVPTSDAKVIVLGPSGAPYAVPTTFDGRRARARFNADRPGTFLIQLLASVAGGPRPVLEASVYADAKPPTSFFGDAAPGEPSAPLPPNADKTAALLEMLNQARRTEQSPPLQRDPTLDGVAERHAQAMRKLKRIAHDAGDGDPRSRVEATGLSILATGENVAHALDVTRAHRALWASPSHRENLLQPRFDKVGIGVALDPDGSIWVCEVFADFPDQVGMSR